MLEKWEHGDPANLLEKKEVREFPPEVRFCIDLIRRVRVAAMVKFGESPDSPKFDSISHDETLPMDAPAEKVIEEAYTKAWSEGKNYGYVTEEQGLILPSYNRKPSKIMMWDPTDGSRSGEAGEEQVVATVVGVDGSCAMRPTTIPTTFDDIQFGVTYSLKEDNLFVVDRSGLYRVENSDALRRVVQKPIKDDMVNVPLGVESFTANEELLGAFNSRIPKKWKSEAASGGFNVLNVATKGKAAIDVRQRMLDTFGTLALANPNQKITKFVSPLDMAAGAMMVEAMGGKITDAYGNPLNKKPLWIFQKDGSWDPEVFISIVAAPSPQLHAQLMESVEMGMERAAKISEFLKANP